MNDDETPIERANDDFLCRDRETGLVIFDARRPIRTQDWKAAGEFVFQWHAGPDHENGESA